MLRPVIRAAAMIALFSARSLAAQCADGSAPPCRAGVAPRSIPIDPNRVAIMPFRVTTADSLLGEGFAELLALEFTGEGGPRAVDMATTLATWRRAGGGLRTPVTHDGAMRVARQVGAGVVCQGTIIGLGGRLTISASIVDAATGRPIGVAARASGSADSIDVLLGQIATGLLGAGARATVAESGRLTRSPAALRAYFEGQALRRRGDRSGAGRAFEASYAADTMFASAAFHRWLISRLVSGSATWAQRMMALRDRLTLDERLMVDASMGDPAAPRTGLQANADLKRAALRVDSPEAWWLYGDNVYHDGLSIVGPDSVVPIARAAFERGLAMDSVPLNLGHLITIAIRTRDTAFARRLSPLIAQYDNEDRWSRGWVIAGWLNDAAQLNRLRQIGPYRQPTVLTGFWLLDAMDAPIPVALVDDGLQQIRSVFPGTAERSRVATFAWLFHRVRGRPIAAEQAVAGLTVQWSANLAGGTFSGFSGDLRDDQEFMRTHGSTRLDSAALERRRQCVSARLTAQRGHADSIDISALRVAAVPRCVRILEIWKAFAANTLAAAALAELDSIVTFSTYASFGGFEHRLLARIYETRGDTARALRAVRHYPRDFPAVWLAPTLREEGKYFLMARDTANAVRSYRHFLELRAEAEAPYVPERDSIRALVTNLTRRR